MPQASEELRQQMNDRFGDPISEAGPIQFLEGRGYALNRDFTWSKGGVTDLGHMKRDEFDCLLFLCHEWDFGGITAQAMETGTDETAQQAQPEG